MNALEFIGLCTVSAIATIVLYIIHLRLMKINWYKMKIADTVFTLLFFQFAIWVYKPSTVRRMVKFMEDGNLLKTINQRYVYWIMNKRLKYGFQNE